MKYKMDINNIYYIHEMYKNYIFWLANIILLNG